MDSMKDHLIPNIGDLDLAKLMFDTMANLYENNNSNRKVALKSQIQEMFYSKSKSITSYFTKIKHLKDQLNAIGVEIDEDELC